MCCDFVSDEIHTNPFVSDIYVNKRRNAICVYCVGRKIFSGAY